MTLPAEAVGPAVHRGRILSFLSDPGDGTHADAYTYFPDGALIVENGRIAALGPAESVLARVPRGTPYAHHGANLLLPGFIDNHIHYAQSDVIGAGGRQLLDWLRDYTFVEESRFSDPEHATRVAEFFLDELARNGTTTALVFCTVHPESVDAFFGAAERRRLRMIAGKVLMDRNAPAGLCDTPSSADRESRALLERWHGKDRLHYAITPRFAATSSDAQLQVAGRLARDFPDAFIHSHLAENREEIAWVRELFPASRSYLDVYDGHGLLRDRAIYAHCIYLDADDRRRMAESGAAAAFCPTSNLYLGSGLFDIAATDAAGMRFSTATDVGGGSSFSMLRTLDEARKVARLQGHDLSPLRAFYLATLGAARCLGLEDRIGRLAVGAEADFIVLDLQATELIARRTAAARTLSDVLRILLTLGDDRAVKATYVLGRQVHGDPAAIGSFTPTQPVTP
ncbi:MAG: guanine deaminase [Gammaproteobacteria bacterium]|nr:guanine deaminase [Gammaproteobacteria bacterium]